MITIIDYKIANLGSMKNMLKKIGQPSNITSDIDEISNADKIILPGVGHFDHGMRRLKESGCIDVLNHVYIISHQILGTDKFLSNLVNKIIKFKKL